MFANIECEWPLFFCYLILDYCFQGNEQGAAEYTTKLEEVDATFPTLKKMNDSIFINLDYDPHR